MSVLKIENMSKEFGKKAVVDNLSLEINKGEIYGLLGPNGAGKSTTINCVMGLISPNSGSITFEGGKSLVEWQKNIGYVPQNIAVYMDLTARENISFFCSLYGFKGDDLKKRVDYALDFVGLKDDADKKAKEFSGGMQRRLNIACAIAHSPKLIIMDEPTAGVDPQSRNHILESVKKLNRDGITVIYTSHYMEEVEFLCDKICIIDHGKVIVHGTKEEIKQIMGNSMVIEINTSQEVKNDEQLKREIESISSVQKCEKVSSFTFNVTSDKSASIISNIVSVFDKLGLDIISITTNEPSLESVFLSITGKELRD
jgi:ABC-2 type transport system ATP-binding protein